MSECACLCHRLMFKGLRAMCCEEPSFFHPKTGDHAPARPLSVEERNRRLALIQPVEPGIMTMGEYVRARREERTDEQKAFEHWLDGKHREIETSRPAGSVLPD